MRKTAKEIVRQSMDCQKEIMGEVITLPLPRDFMAFVERYESLGCHRERFLWQWAWKVLNAKKPGFMFSSVDSEKERDAALVKLLLLMAVTIADDTADNMRNKELLDIILDVPFADKIELNGTLDTEQKETIRLLQDILALSFEKLGESENWSMLREIFLYDLRQVWNAFLYSYLLNVHPEMINFQENIVYGAHNMMAFVFANIDLIYSDQFDKADLSLLREVVHRAQEMGRIGNWISTWEREIPERDFTSGIVSLLISDGHIDVTTLESLIKDGDIETIKVKVRKANLEDKLLQKWEQNREHILRLGTRIRSINIDAYVDGLELLMLYHCASRGLK